MKNKVINTIFLLTLWQYNAASKLTKRENKGLLKGMNR